VTVLCPRTDSRESRRVTQWENKLPRKNAGQDYFEQMQEARTAGCVNCHRNNKGQSETEESGTMLLNGKEEEQKKITTGEKKRKRDVGNTQNSVNLAERKSSIRPNLEE